MAYAILAVYVALGAAAGYWAVRKPDAEGKRRPVAVRLAAALVGAVAGLALAGVFGFTDVLFSGSAPLAHVTTADQLEAALTAPEPVTVLFFSSPTCPPCRVLEPRLTKLQDEWRGRARFVKANVGHSSQLVQQFQVRATPTLVVFQGQTPVSKVEGALSKREVAALLAQAEVLAQVP